MSSHAPARPTVALPAALKPGASIVPTLTSVQKRRHKSKPNLTIKTKDGDSTSQAAPAKTPKTPKTPQRRSADSFETGFMSIKTNKTSFESAIPTTAVQAEYMPVGAEMKIREFTVSANATRASSRPNLDKPLPPINGPTEAPSAAWQSESPAVGSVAPFVAELPANESLNVNTPFSVRNDLLPRGRSPSVSPNPQPVGQSDSTLNPSGPGQDPPPSRNANRARVPPAKWATRLDSLQPWKSSERSAQNQPPSLSLFPISKASLPSLDRNLRKNSKPPAQDELSTSSESTRPRTSDSKSERKKIWNWEARSLHTPGTPETRKYPPLPFALPNPFARGSSDRPRTSDSKSNGGAKAWISDPIPIHLPAPAETKKNMALPTSTPIATQPDGRFRGAGFTSVQDKLSSAELEAAPQSFIPIRSGDPPTPAPTPGISSVKPTTPATNAFSAASDSGALWQTKRPPYPNLNTSNAPPSPKSTSMAFAPAIAPAVDMLKDLARQCDELHTRYAKLRAERQRISSEIVANLNAPKPGPDYVNTMLNDQFALAAVCSSMDICVAKLKSLECRKEDAVATLIARSTPATDVFVTPLSPASVDKVSESSRDSPITPSTGKPLEGKSHKSKTPSNETIPNTEASISNETIPNSKASISTETVPNSKATTSNGPPTGLTLDTKPPSTDKIIENKRDAPALLSAGTVHERNVSPFSTPSFEKISGSKFSLANASVEKTAETMSLAGKTSESKPNGKVSESTGITRKSMDGRATRPKTPTADRSGRPSLSRGPSAELLAAGKPSTLRTPSRERPTENGVSPSGPMWFEKPERPKSKMQEFADMLQSTPRSSMHTPRHSLHQSRSTPDLRRSLGPPALNTHQKSPSNAGIVDPDAPSMPQFGGVLVYGENNKFAGVVSDSTKETSRGQSPAFAANENPAWQTPPAVPAMQDSPKQDSVMQSSKSETASLKDGKDPVGELEDLLSKL